MWDGVSAVRHAQVLKALWAFPLILLRLLPRNRGGLRYVSARTRSPVAAPAGGPCPEAGHIRVEEGSPHCLYRWIKPLRRSRCGCREGATTASFP